MKDVITTLIPRYGELNRIYKDWFDNKGFSFEKQKFITKFYLDYNDVTVLETAILELVFHLPQEQYTLILNSLKKEVCENISYYKKGCMPDEQTVYNICFRVSEIYKEAIEEQQYKTTKLHAPLNEAYHRYDSIGYREHTAEDEKRAEMEYERCKDEYEEKKNKLTDFLSCTKINIIIIHITDNTCLYNFKDNRINGLRPLRRTSVHARHDGHHPEPGPERRGC